MWPKWFSRLFQAPKKVPILNDYGHGYEARELVDGTWVLWHKGNACDLETHGYAWEPGERFFRDCVGTREQVDAAAKHIMSARGCFKVNK